MDSEKWKALSVHSLRDSATNFQQAVLVIRTDAESLLESIQDCWFHWAGPCKQMIIDNASPLCSEQVTVAAQERDIHLRVVAAYAHWQMGKTEHHGDIIQDMLHKYDIEHPIQSEDHSKLHSDMSVVPRTPYQGPRGILRRFWYSAKAVLFLVALVMSFQVLPST